MDSEGRTSQAGGTAQAEIQGVKNVGTVSQRRGADGPDRGQHLLGTTSAKRGRSCSTLPPALGGEYDDHLHFKVGKLRLWKSPSLSRSFPTRAGIGTWGLNLATTSSWGGQRRVGQDRGYKLGLPPVGTQPPPLVRVLPVLHLRYNAMG